MLLRPMACYNKETKSNLLKSKIGFQQQWTILKIFHNKETNNAVICTLQ